MSKSQDVQQKVTDLGGETPDGPGAHSSSLREEGGMDIPTNRQHWQCQVFDGSIVHLASFLRQQMHTYSRQLIISTSIYSM